MTGHIFISYARQDGRQYAEQLQQTLTAAQLPVWYDNRNLDPYQDYSAELEQAIEASSKVICCITEDVKREGSFVRRELQYALNLKKPIIPLLFDRVGWTPIHIATVTHIDFGLQGWDASIQTLLTRLRQTDDRTYEQVKLPADPYRDYLKALYDQIVSYLNQTVFSLIALRGAAVPDAVNAPPKQVLPVSFFAIAGVKQQPQAYQNFQQAYDDFNGRGLLLGDPGAGKTTTLFAFSREMIARRLDDPTQPLPILAPIATWDAVQQPGIIDWLAALIPVFSLDELAQIVTQGQALLLLDGLDELGAEREEPKTKERYDPRLRFIRQLEADVTTGRVIITCRIKDYNDLNQKIALRGAARLQPLDDAQMQVYLQDMPALWEALQADPDLRAIARTPLLMSLFMAAYREATPDELQQLRDLRASPGDVSDKIFEMFVRKSYEREARKPFGALKFSLDEINDLLSELAAHDLNRKNGAPHLIPAKLVKKVMKQEARTRDLVDLTGRLYLFVQHNRAHYGFIHLLLRDYYAYQYARRQLNRASDEDRYQALTTLRLLGDERNLSIFTRFLQYPQPKIQVLAAAALGELNDQSAVDPLIASLEVNDSGVRRGIVSALSMLRDERAIPALLEVAGKDKDIWVRLRAATALRHLQQQHVAFDIFKAALSNSFYEVRLYGTSELGRLGDVRAVELLIPMLQDSSVKVQRTAERALSRFGTPAAAEAVEAWQRQHSIE